MRQLFRVVMVAGLSLVAGAPAFADASGEVKGKAEYRKGDILIVGGRRVRVTASTKVKGAPAGQALPLGYEVKAKGVWAADGTLLARQLEGKPNTRDQKEADLIKTCNDIEEIYRENGQALRPSSSGVVNLGDIATRGPQYDRARRVLDRLLPAYVPASEVRLYVVGNPEWNAFAMANFAIFVHSGLLEDMNDDELAIVLGHELAHATLEHSRRSMQKSRWGRLTAGITSIGGSVLTVVGGDLGSLGGDALRGIGGLGAGALSNGFSRGFEDEADRIGLRYAYEGGFKAETAPALWRRFSAKYKDQSGVKNFLFGSHSQSGDRARNLEEELAKNYKPGSDTPSH
jgi:Zn-dependent protease with chaperone function